MTNSLMPTQEMDEVSDWDKVKQRIIRTLTHYPRLTKTMLGSQVSSYGSLFNISWHDVLEEMIADDHTVKRTLEDIDGKPIYIYSLT